MKKKANEAIKATKRDYSVELKYSDEAKEKKLIKFTALRRNREFVISLDEITKLIMLHLNKEYIPMLEVKNECVDMIIVERSITGKCSRDYKEGELISFNYEQPMPVEMAIAEEAYNICKLGEDIVKVPAENLSKAQEELNARQKQYLEFTHKEYMKQFNKEEQEVSEVESIEAPPEPIESPYLEDK